MENTLKTYFKVDETFQNEKLGFGFKKLKLH